VIHSSTSHFIAAMQFEGLAPCPQDGRWLIPTDSDICTEIETLQLLFGFVRMLRPRVVIETGCNVGCASSVICEALKANGDQGQLYTCDVVPEFVEKARARCGWPANVSCCTAMEMLDAIGLADLYWIDSSEDSRAAELEWLMRHGKKGAVVLVHDTNLMGHLAQLVRGFPNHVLLPGPRGLGVITL